MARGLFDLINAYNAGMGGMGAGGYAPFDPGFMQAGISPQQAVALQARGNLMSSPGTGPSLIGNVAGGLLGAGLKKGWDKYQASRPENQLKAAMHQQLKTALGERVAKMMKDNPQLDIRRATTAAAEELYAWTARSKQDPALVEMAREMALGTASEMGEFDSEAQERFASARQKNAEIDAMGKKMVTVMDKTTRALQTMPEATASEAIKANPNLMLIDNPPLSSLNETQEVLEGDEEATYRYSPQSGFGEIGRGPASLGKGRTSVTYNAPNDASTESDLSKRENDLMGSFAGMEAINHAIDQISATSIAAEKSGVKGTTGTLGKMYGFLGEGATLLQAASGAAKQISDKYGDKAYNDGTMTYGELVNPDRYDDKLFPGIQKSGRESKRIKAAMINLAYLLAITQESSARAISDNDIKLRLQTLGSDISSGKGMRQVLEDRRRDALFSLRSRLRVDKTFSNDPHYKGLLGQMFKQYNIPESDTITEDNEEGTPDNSVSGGEPIVTIGPNGISVRNKP